MKIKLIFVLFTLFIASSCIKHSPDKKGNSSFATKEIPLLKIKNKLLYPMLDSVINHKQRLFYSKPLPLYIASYDTLVNFGCDTSYFYFYHSLNYCNFTGAFKYKNCLFIALNINKKWFEITNKKMRFVYKIDKSHSLLLGGQDLLHFIVKGDGFALDRRPTE
jgi:hypothetical protein